MQESKPDEKHIEIWNSFKASLVAYQKAVGVLFLHLNSTERIELVRWALKNQQKNVALRATQLMNVEERKALLDILIGFTHAGTGSRKFVSKLILDIPHDWLIENIERYTEPILNQYEDHADYSGFLWLLHDIDKQLAVRLAERAKRSSDPDIQEIGEGYLE